MRAPGAANGRSFCLCLRKVPLLPPARLQQLSRTPRLCGGYQRRRRVLAARKAETSYKLLQAWEAATHTHTHTHYTRGVEESAQRQVLCGVSGALFDGGGGATPTGGRCRC